MASVLLALAAGAAQIAPADDPPLSEVQDAVQRGEILPLKELLELATARVPGEVIGVEIEDDDGLLEYEITILATNGRVREVTLDARDGRILEVEDD